MLAIDPPLMEAAKSGDAAALEKLLVVCQPDIRRYARRTCLISDVEDGVQEALLILTRHVRSLKHPAALSGWLFRVVQRECMRLARAALRLDRREEAKLDALLARESDASLRVDLAAALESLPEHYRDVVLLRDFEELTIGEMSQRLADSPAAIKSRLHRARELVREYLLA